MGRRERRQLHKEKAKYIKTHPRDWDTAPWYGKILLLSVPLFFILGSLYIALHNSDITEEELTYQRATLKKAPVYSGGKHPSIKIQTKEFFNPFTIEGITLEACSVNAIINQMNANESITLQYLIDDIDDLNKTSFFNSSVSLYGLRKDGTQYIDLDLRNKLQKEDNQWAYMGVGFGLIILYYVLAKRQPKLAMDDALGQYSIAFILILLLWYFAKK